MSEIAELRTTSPAPTAPPADAAPAATPRRAALWWRQELLPLLRRVHFYAGLAIAPFLLVLAVTGLLYTLTPQLDQLVYHDQLTAPVPAATAPAPIDRQVVAATRSIGLPASTVSEVRPPGEAGATTRVVFQAPGLADGYFRTVFVDPYTARVRGTLTTYGEWMPIRSWFDELHRTLHLGSVGEVYSEVGASWLWVIVLSGLGMWLSRRWRRGERRRMVLPRRGTRGRGRLVSRHGALGLVLALGLLFLSATGITWSQFGGAHVTAVRQAFSWSTPTVHTATAARHPETPTRKTGSASGSVPEPGPTHVFADGDAGSRAFADQARRVLTVARDHQLGDPVELDPPTKAGQAWVVKQVQRSWPEKQDAISVDPATGAVVDQLRFADWPLAAKLARWGVDAHMGLLFGLANQVVLALIALGLIAMITWGYRMWWKRRPKPVTGHPPPSAATLVTVGAAAIVVGVFLPALGVTLLLFLVFDALRGRRRAPEASEPAGVAT